MNNKCDCISKPAWLVVRLAALLFGITSFLSPAWPDTGYQVTSNLWGPYRTGPFASFAAGADDIVTEYKSHYPSGYETLQWPACGSPPTAPNSSWLVYVKRYNTACWSSEHWVIPRACPVGQLAQWLTSTSWECQDYKPMNCQNVGSWDGITCGPCPDGLQGGPFNGQCAAPAAAAKNAGQPRDCPRDQCANPIKPGTGQKYQQETVFRTPTLELLLSYNSPPVEQMPRAPTPFGRGWSFNYGMRVWMLAQNQAGALRPDGKVYQFQPPASGNVYVSDADVPDRLEKLVSGSTITGWELALRSGSSSAR